MTREFIHVVAAAVMEGASRVLLAQRPLHVHQGGKWEFPGGKVEAGETAHAALVRELREEVGIRPAQARPLIRIRHRYTDKSVLLDVWRVDEYEGRPHGVEGQPVRWVDVAELDAYPLPDANAPIVSALRLPSEYAITGSVAAEPDAFLRRLRRMTERGVRLVQLRLGEYGATEAATPLLERAVRLVQVAGGRVLFNGAPERALRLGADGVHLSAARAAALSGRPLPTSHLVGVSCHDAEELTQAARIGADFAVLSPVSTTQTHPGAVPLGWSGFEALTEWAPMPVFALGGVGPVDLTEAWRHGAQGVAGIRAFWD